MSSRNLLVALVVVVLLVLAYTVVSQPDQRTASEKVGDAIHELPNGVGKATHELSNDRTPGEKIGDAVRRTGDKIKENSNPND